MNCFKEDALIELRGLGVATLSRGSGSPAQGPAEVPRFTPSTRIGVNFVCIHADNQIFKAVLPDGLTVA